MHLQNAPKEYRAREIDDTHVTELASSFSKTGTVNPDSIVIIMSNRVKKLIENDELIRWSEVLSLASDKRVPLYMIGGNHTLRTLNRLQEEWPRSPTWRVLSAKVIVCNDNEANRRLFRVYSNLLNAKHVQKSTTWNQCAIQMHNTGVGEVESMQRQFKGDPAQRAFCAAKATPSMLTQESIQIIQKDLVDTTVFGAPSVTAYWGLAKRGGEMWDLLLKLMTKSTTPMTEGVGKAKKGKTFKVPGYNVYSQMGDIPDAALLPMLRNFAGGVISDKAFTKGCIIYKAMRRLKNYTYGHAVQVINSNKEWRKQIPGIGKAPSGGQFDETIWKSLLEVLPVFDTDAFTNKWLRSFQEMSKKLGAKASEEFYSEVANHVSAAMSKLTNQVIHPSTFVLYLACHHAYIMRSICKCSQQSCGV
jgi:hypothetical protein